MCRQGLSLVERNDASVQATTIASALAVCAHATCGIHIAINLQSTIYHAEGNASNLKFSLHGQIVTNGECLERSLWCQCHKVFDARAIASTLPCRLEESKVCTKVLLADDERCRVCVYLSVNTPIDSTICQVARTVKANKRSSCILGDIPLVVETNDLSIVHVATPPCCNSVALGGIVHDTIDTTLHISSLRVTQGDEGAEDESTVDVGTCVLAQSFLQVIVGSHIAYDSIQLSYDGTCDVCASQAKLVVEGIVCRLEIVVESRNTAVDVLLAIGISRIVPSHDVGDIGDEFLLRTKQSCRVRSECSLKVGQLASSTQHIRVGNLVI